MTDGGARKRREKRRGSNRQAAKTATRRRRCNLWHRSVNSTCYQEQPRTFVREPIKNKCTDARDDRERVRARVDARPPFMHRHLRLMTKWNTIRRGIVSDVHGLSFQETNTRRHRTSPTIWASLWLTFECTVGRARVRLARDRAGRRRARDPIRAGPAASLRRRTSLW